MILQEWKKNMEKMRRYMLENTYYLILSFVL